MLLLLCVNPSLRGFCVRDFFLVDRLECRGLAVYAAFAAGDLKVECLKDHRLNRGVHLFRSCGVIAAFHCKENAVSVKKNFRVRMPYDPSEDVGIAFDQEEGLTQQSFKEECDINNIMRRYNSTGVITHLNARAPEWGDFSSPVDFQAGLNTVLEAQAMFSDLPSDLRERFGNDPLKLLEFVADERNRDEAVKLGIVKAPEPEAPPARVHVVKDDNAPPVESPKPA